VTDGEPEILEFAHVVLEDCLLQPEKIGEILGTDVRVVANQA
jgi:hypothetical protein